MFNREESNSPPPFWNMPPRQIIRQRPFITLWCMFMLNALCVIFISSLYKTYGENEVVNDDSFLTTLGAFAAICNAVGRILWGLYADKASFKVGYCIFVNILIISLAATFIVLEH